MQNTAILLIAVTLFLLVIIVGLLSVLIYRLLKQPVQSQATTEIPKSEFHPGILQRLKDIEKVKPKRADLFCPNHSEEPGEVTCAVCDKLFCKACIKPFKAMHLCKEHFPVVMNNDWDEVLTLKTSSADPEEGVRLYEAKKRIFEDLNLLTYVETHYKINVDHDFIETYLVVFSIKENLEKVKKELTHI